MNVKEEKLHPSQPPIGATSYQCEKPPQLTTHCKISTMKAQYEAWMEHLLKVPCMHNPTARSAAIQTRNTHSCIWFRITVVSATNLQTLIVLLVHQVKRSCTYRVAVSIGTCNPLYAGSHVSL